jgi:thiamine-monophosphate kinase
MTEDGLIEAIAALNRGTERVLLGIGDDAAVWQPSRSHRSVISTDALVEGVHFDRAWMSPEEIGERAMAANLSDLAAMAARPRLGTIALGVPEAWTPEMLLAMYAGLVRCANAHGLQIAGGDLVRAPVLTIAITVVGEVRPAHVKTRSGAKPGDAIAVTGPLGASRAGLDLLRGAAIFDGAAAEAALRAHRTPQPRIAEGRWLGASSSVRAMMDCSDGLSTDLARMARASGIGVRIERVPVAGAARVAAQKLGIEAETYALAGGEDFELLVAIETRAFGHLSRRFQARFGRPLERVGRFQADEQLVVVKEGHEEPLARTGWDHFARESIG